MTGHQSDTDGADRAGRELTTGHRRDIARRDIARMDAQLAARRQDRLDQIDAAAATRATRAGLWAVPDDFTSDDSDDFDPNYSDYLDDEPGWADEEPAPDPTRTVLPLADYAFLRPAEAAAAELAAEARSSWLVVAATAPANDSAPADASTTTTAAPGQPSTAHTAPAPATPASNTARPDSVRRTR